jgi:hypothetical protein
MIAALATGASLVSTDSAYAYLDPGTATLLLQGIIGGVAAGLVVIKLYWRKLKGLFGLGRAPAESATTGRMDKSTNR